MDLFCPAFLRPPHLLIEPFLDDGIKAFLDDGISLFVLVHDDWMNYIFAGRSVGSGDLIVWPRCLSMGQGRSVH